MTKCYQRVALLGRDVGHPCVSAICTEICVYGNCVTNLGRILWGFHADGDLHWSAQEAWAFHQHWLFFVRSTDVWLQGGAAGIALRGN